MGFSGIILLFVICSSFLKSQGGKIKWTNVKVKYTPLQSGVFDLPLTTDKVGKDYQFLKAHDDFPKVSLYVAPGDPRLQVMYDDHKNICGLRVAYIIDQIDKKTRKGDRFPYSYENKPYFRKGNALEKTFYYIDVLFIDPDVLKNGGPTSRPEPTGTGVYIKMDGKTWTEMPRTEDGMKSTNFTKQGCFLGMGRHYFYKMTPQMKCEDDHPVFLLFHSGELFGLGLVPFGTFDSKFGKPWFEDPPKEIIDAIVSTGPTCLKEWVGKYGTISLHIFFSQHSELAYC